MDYYSFTDIYWQVTDCTDWSLTYNALMGIGPAASRPEHCHPQGNKTDLKPYLHILTAVPCLTMKTVLTSLPNSQLKITSIYCIIIFTLRHFLFLISFVKKEQEINGH